MKKSETLIVKKPLLSWIFRGNRKLKLLLVMTVFVTIFVRIVPLEMQKRIVNQAIQLKAFELLWYLSGGRCHCRGTQVRHQLFPDNNRATRPGSQANRPVPSCANAAIGRF